MWAGYHDSAYAFHADGKTHDPPHSILNSLACDDKWWRIGVMSSVERLENWLNAQDIAMFELD